MKKVNNASVKYSLKGNINDTDETKVNNSANYFTAADLWNIHRM